MIDVLTATVLCFVALLWCWYFFSVRPRAERAFGQLGSNYAAAKSGHALALSKLVEAQRIHDAISLSVHYADEAERCEGEGDYDLAEAYDEMSDEAYEDYCNLKARAAEFDVSGAT